MPVIEKVELDLKDTLRTPKEIPTKTVEYVPSRLKDCVESTSLDPQSTELHESETVSDATAKRSIDEKLMLKSFDDLSFDNHKYSFLNIQNSYLQPGCKFSGIQQSSKAKYKINVEFKQVDLANSLVIGFLKINGLTEEYPEIITCFKGEIINNPLKALSTSPLSNEYTFYTRNKSWGSSLYNDLDHWKRLSNMFSLTDDEFIKKLNLISNYETDKGLIYMRWKEEFLLPDARIKLIEGASFEGFYYVVLNIGNKDNVDFPIGSINGLYYYHKSEKFQSLNLASEVCTGKQEVFQFL